MKKIILAIILILTPCVSYATCTWDGNTCVVSACGATYQNTSFTEIKNNTLGKTGVVIMQLPACDTAEETPQIVDVNMTSGLTGITGLVIRGYGTTPPSSVRASAGLTKLTNINYRVRMSASKTIRISNITVAGGASSEWYQLAIFRFTNSSVYPSGGFRLDHITFDSPTGMGWFTDRGAYGVIDSCSGDIYGKNAQYNDDSDTSGNDSWQRGAVLGSINSVYVENIETRAVRNPASSAGNQGILMIADVEYGGRVAVRYNNITNYYIGGHDASSTQRSGLQVEAYNNVSTHTIDVPNYASAYSYDAPHVAHRGGTGVIYNNDFIQVEDIPYYVPTAMLFRNTRSNGGVGSFSIWTSANAGTCDVDGKKACLTGDRNGSLIMCTTDADCGGTSGSCQYVDGDGVTTHLPCRDQIGTGNNTSSQASMPFLLWGNREKRGSGDWATSTVTSLTTDIALNRDYCEHATTMPATCNGVETTYVEYTCPHPATDYTGSCDSNTRGVAGYNITEADDVTPPTVVSGLINTNGTSLTVVLSEDVTINDSSGFGLVCDKSPVALTYVSEDGGILSFSHAVVSQSATCVASYTTVPDGIEDAAGNDLATIESFNITNQSQQAEPPLRELTVNATRATVTSAPSGINCGSTCAYEFENNTTVTLGGYCDTGSRNLTITGDCASNGTVSMTGAKACTATCEKIQVLYLIAP